MGLTANELSLLKGTGGSNPLASAAADPSATKQLKKAPVAQRIEHLTTDQKVRGSNPFGRTIYQRKWLQVPSCKTSESDTFKLQIPHLQVEKYLNA